MEFKENEAIYLQIAALVCDNILSGKWIPGEKIMSVRDLAIELQVNPHTVTRAYDFLQAQEIISTKRGLGLFVADNGLEKVNAYRTEIFFEQSLPQFFKEMYLLGILPKEIEKRYQAFVAAQKKNSTGKKL